MDIIIERITNENYSMFDDMVAWRINGKERTVEEKAETSQRYFIFDGALSGDTAENPPHRALSLPPKDYRILQREIL